MLENILLAAVLVGLNYAHGYCTKDCKLSKQSILQRKIWMKPWTYSLIKLVLLSGTFSILYRFGQHSWIQCGFGILATYMAFSWGGEHASSNFDKSRAIQVPRISAWLQVTADSLIQDNQQLSESEALLQVFLSLKDELGLSKEEILEICQKENSGRDAVIPLCLMAYEKGFRLLSK